MFQSAWVWMHHIFPVSIGNMCASEQTEFHKCKKLTLSLITVNFTTNKI